MHLTPIHRLLAVAVYAALVAVGCEGSEKPEVEATTQPSAPPSLVLREGQWEQLDPGEQAAQSSLVSIRQKHELGKRHDLVMAVKKHLKKFPGDPTCEEAMFVAGEAEYDHEQFYQAFAWYEKQLARYPSGPFSERALLREMEIGKGLMGGEKRQLWRVIPIKAADEGIEILQKVAEHAPGTKLAEDALMHIGDWRYERGEFDKAVETYDQFLKLMPRSRLASQAMLNGAHATLEQYRGVEYDESPLLEAHDRYLFFQETYPQIARREDVGQILSGIVDAQAERLMHCAGFYERTNRPKAAVYYYRKILEDFPDTYHAISAETSLAGLGWVEPVKRSTERRSRGRRRATTQPRPDRERPAVSPVTTSPAPRTVRPPGSIRRPTVARPRPRPEPRPREPFGPVGEPMP